MPLKPSDNPQFSEQLTELNSDSVASAGTWNPIHQALLDNDINLRKAIQDGNDLVGGKVQDLGQRLTSVEATSSVAVQKAVGLDWLYRGNAITFELFTDGYTLIDTKPVAVVQGISGDDSLDVADTSALKAGEYYVLSDTTLLNDQGQAAPVSALVQVQSVLSSARIRLAANMARTWGPSATLRRSSIAIESPGAAKARPGDVYLSRAINIGTDVDGGAVVIRRSLNAGLARLYYRDGYQVAWKEVGWSMRRQGGSVPSGMADYEYILPMRGDGWLRLDIEGEAIDISHVVALGMATGLGGYINPELRPLQPAMAMPAAGATGIMERPTLQISKYLTPSGNAQAGIQFQIAKDAAFTNVVLDTGAVGAVLSYGLNAGVLVAGTTYYVRARTLDVAGLWSDWSAGTNFTTAASFAYVAAPTITGPQANATDIAEQPTFSTSAFSVVGATDTHASSQFRVRSADGPYVTPVWDSGEDVTNKVSIVMPAGKIKAGGNVYYVQARHKGTSKGWGEWSSEIKFTTKAQFANVIGIVMVASGGGSGTWARVDENGNPKVTDAAFFGSHPVYGAIQDVIIDGQEMVRIPAFYVKAGSVSSGQYAGKRAWWVSDQPLAGYSLHPAFMDAGNPLSQFWVGKFQATPVPGESTIGSLKYAAPTVGLSLADFKDRANQRNVGGVTGFSIWNYYQLQAIQLLCVIEVCGTDSQTLLGKGNTESSGAFNSYSAQATWRGVVGLWGNVHQIVDGLKSNASVLQIWDKQGNKTYVNTGVSAASRTSYADVPSADSGASYDLSIGFVPSTLTSSENSSFGGDMVSYWPDCIAYHGGYWGSGSSAGLFCLYIAYKADSTGGKSVGTRIAKV